MTRLLEMPDHDTQTYRQGSEGHPRPLPRTGDPAQARRGRDRPLHPRHLTFRLKFDQITPWPWPSTASKRSSSACAQSRRCGTATAVATTPVVLAQGVEVLSLSHTDYMCYRAADSTWRGDCEEADPVISALGTCGRSSPAIDVRIGGSLLLSPTYASVELVPYSALSLFRRRSSYYAS